MRKNRSLSGLLIVALAATIHPIVVSWREVFVALTFGIVALSCSYPRGNGFIEGRRGPLLPVLYGTCLTTVLQTAA